MFASSESHMASDVGPAHNEIIRILEDFRIAIGGGVAQSDRFPGTYCLAVQMDIFGRCTRETSVWAVKTKKLFHRRWN